MGPKFLVEGPLLGIGPRRLRMWALLNLRHKGPSLTPSFIRPRDYNEKIQWLKLFDQRIEQVQCSDKLGLRYYVQGRGLDVRMPEVLWSGIDADEIPWDALPDQFVVKTNHDSGSVWLINDKTGVNRADLNSQIRESLGRLYGVDTLEWPYVHIEPKVFVEQMLGFGGEPPPDYKFHCVNGRVAFLQLIKGRYTSSTDQAVFDRDGVKQPHALDTRFIPSTQISAGPQFEYLRDCAEQIAAGWRYVRVDLYLWEDTAWLGEMSFFPMAGWYRGEGQIQLGSRIVIDTSKRYPPVSNGERLFRQSASYVGR